MNKMPPKAAATKDNDTKRNIIVVPSKVYSQKDSNTSKPEDLEGVEETEITAQISVPAEGGWGWVVVAASFSCIFVLDGIFFTFGSIFHDMADDLQIEESLVALSNSIAVAVYFMAGPMVSALINRFGFRAICMSGSVICSMAFLSTYFAVNYSTIVVVYGFMGGFGACLTSMSAGLVVGFYFERLRALAMSISSIGSSVGIMVLFSVNTYVVNVAGWRVVMLLHSGLLGTMFFFAMTFRPLLSLTVSVAPNEDTRTVTYLPSLAAMKSTPSKTNKEVVTPTATERLFSAVSNAHFPTAATVVGESTVTTPTQAGPSTAVASKLTLTAQGPQGAISLKQLKQVQSLITKSKTSVPDKDEKNEMNIEININIEPPKKQPWWQRLCHWEKHVAQARPMYRDDAFYAGKLEQLDEYKKSKLDTSPEARTGLEYQMAVSRAVTAVDLKERRGFYTTAVRRVLATMMDPKLLKKISFLCLCSSGFFLYVGYLVPFVFLPDRAKGEGIEPTHCNLFVSVIGFANALGRLFIGALAMKVNPLYLYLVVSIISGLAIMAFNFSFNLYYQYAVCIVFGFHIASLSCIRSIVIVYLYGLDRLTNATGVMIMFQGLGSLISTPASSVIKNAFGYSVSFYVAGFSLVISGLVLIPVKKLNDKEKLKEMKEDDDKGNKDNNMVPKESSR